MRLIDADKLKQIIDKKETWILELIDEEPTAYDVDKVVEELRDCSMIISNSSIVYHTHNDMVSKAIEIVKAGGKNEAN